MDSKDDAIALHDQYFIPVIKAFIGDATRVRIDYGTVIAVHNDTADIQFLGGAIVTMKIGKVTPIVGKVWRCRRRYGSWVTDDWARP